MSARVDVRMARSDDADAVAHLWRLIDQSWEPNSNMRRHGFGKSVPYDFDSMRAFVRDATTQPDKCTLVAEDAGGVCGVICVATGPFYFNASRKMAYVVCLGVHPRRRRDGIGGLLLRDAMSRATKEGVAVFSGVVPEVDGERALASSVYANLGFVEIESTWAKELT